MPIHKSLEYSSIITFLDSFETINFKLQQYHPYDISNKENLLSTIKFNNESTHDLSLEDDYIFFKRYQYDFIEVFKHLSDIHYMRYNGKIYLKNDNLEKYQFLSSSIDTVPLMSYYILQSIDLLSIDNKLRFIDNINFEFKFYGDLKKRVLKYSDLHIHLGGTLSFSNRLHNILKDINSIKLDLDDENLFKKDSHCSMQIKDIAFITSILENILIKIYITKSEYNQEKIKKDLKDILEILKNQEKVRNYIEYRKYTFAHNNIRHNCYLESQSTCDEYFGKEFEDKILQYMFQNFSKSQTDKGDRFLIMFLLLKIESKDEYKEIIEIYFVLRSIIKQFLVQQHKREGLGYFSLYSQNPIRRAKKDYEKELIIQRILHKNNITKNIEARISLSESSELIIKEMREYIDLFKEYKGDNDKLKFIFHFKKEADKNISNDYPIDDKDIFLYFRPKWFKLRKKIKQQSFALKDILTNPAYRKYPIYPTKISKLDKISSKNIYKLQKIKYKDYVKKYISGIDVAGKEYLTPPEVYAPIYRYFKNSIETSGKILKRTYPYIENEKLDEINFKYTYHVGEDFRDILSGLRSIYEAILFFDLRDGDRIAHALALGINPKEFLSNRNHKIRLTKLETLDNAIFAYYMIDYYNIHIEGVKNFLRETIFGLSKEIYHTKYTSSNFNFTIHDLIDAWFLRRNCPNEILMCKDLFGQQLFIGKQNNTTYELKELLQDENRHYLISNFNYVKDALPDFILINQNDSPIHKRYKNIHHNPIAYSLYWLYQRDPYVQKVAQEEHEENFILPEDFYEYLQDIMMEHILSKRDIVIESALSSNILIGNIQEYSSHPIFRFNPIGNIEHNQFEIRTKKLNVVLGTDNAGIQNTCFMKELYHLYNACIKKGYTNSESYKYILKILENSNLLF